MKFVMVTLAASTLGWVCLSGPGYAQADASQKALASQAFDDAQALMASGRASEACPKYEESQRLDAQLGTLLHLAECYDKVGKTASAWASFKDAVEIAVQRKDPREPRARARIAELEARVAKLTITIPPNAPANLEIRDDGRVLGRPIWGWPVPVDPGKHKISAKAPGYKAWSSVVEVLPGNGNITVAIPELQPDPSPVAQHASSVLLSSTSQSTSQSTLRAPTMALTPPVAGPGGVDSSTDSGAPLRTAGYLLGGAGIVGIGLGSFFALEVQSKVADRDSLNGCSSQGGCTEDQALRIQQMTDDARSNNTMAAVAFAAGGAALAGGIVLVIAGLPRESKVGKSLLMHPWVGSATAGFSVRGGF